MNVRKTLTLSLALVLTAVSAATAAPGTNKARGVFSGGGWESGGMARSRPSYSYRAPAYSAPVAQPAPAPMVAQAPAEGRRFSYAPSAPAMNGTPCPQGQAPAAVAPTVEGDRRYSYAPSAEAPASSTPTMGTYYARPNYYSGGGGRSTVDRWALPKTDARKYNSR